jgi:hypothetical protein
MDSQNAQIYEVSAGVDAAFAMTPCLNSEQTKEERHGQP